MMNNEDLYGTANVRAMSKLSVRSEGHTLRLASASDLWYSGGGAFEPKTFGYTGRPSKAIGGWRTFGISALTIRSSIPSAQSVLWPRVGKGVTAAIYSEDANGQLAYLETSFQF
jgi:hypothetical protein